MALVVLTDEQRFAISNNPRFQNLTRMAVNNNGVYWFGNDGSSIPPAELVHWAKSRSLSYGIVAFPNSIDVQSWVAQFVNALKDIPVVDNINPYDENAVIDYMVANNVFQTLANKVFDLRIIEIGF
jgi:hypothetical protein